MYDSSPTMNASDMQKYNVTDADIDAVEEVAREAGFPGDREDVSKKMRMAFLNGKMTFRAQTLEKLMSRKYWDDEVSPSSH
jgi:hypothetical protein